MSDIGPPAFIITEAAAFPVYAQGFPRKDRAADRSNIANDGFDRIRALRSNAGFGPIISRSGLYNATPERGRTFQARIADGTIHPGLERRAAVEMIESYFPSLPKRGTR